MSKNLLKYSKYKLLAELIQDLILNIYIINKNIFITTINKHIEYTGKEYDQTHGLNLYDYGARFYDPGLGRFLTMDPLAEKYYSVSPYAYCLNNPIRFLDPDGKDIRIANNTATALTNLAKIAATLYGQIVLNKLIQSRQIYETNSVFWSGSSKYKGQTINYVGNTWLDNMDGGSSANELLMGHEIYHAFQDENFMIQQYKGIIKNALELEKGAVGFENYLRSVYGKSPMREEYSGLKNGNKDYFKPYYFNNNGETISNFTILRSNEKKRAWGLALITKSLKLKQKKYYIVVNSDKDKNLITRYTTQKINITKQYQIGKYYEI